jgi:hypothetical protein
MTLFNPILSAEPGQLLHTHAAFIIWGVDGAATRTL